MSELLILMTTAISIGFFHTLLGPDHYLPFIVMSRSGNWSWRKTTWVTALCGMGHVLSSVLLGMIGIALGIAATKLEAVESFRGNIAAWALIAFGLVYFVWGMRRALRHKPHQHAHVHEDGITHIHTHMHTNEHVHPHEGTHTKRITPWVLFTIFLFGPCEPLIPLLMYPAAQDSLPGLIVAIVAFGAITIVTMLSIVLISTLDIIHVPKTRLERYSHAVAGSTLFFCGIAIQFLGW